MTWEQLVAQAWPAAQNERIGDWLLRYSGGVTKRANSVQVLGPAERPGPRELDAAVAEVEGFYAGHGLPSCFQLGPGAPDWLAGELAGRGYRTVDPTLIMTAPLTGPEPDVPDPEPVTVHDRPSLDWLDAWLSVDGRGGPEQVPWARTILTGHPSVYAEVGGDSGGPPRAVGRGVPQGEWLGVYCMATEPSQRRRGYGAAVLRTLRAWGARRGAERAYLLVTEANKPALRLYERAGFEVAAHYSYQVKG
ncbi:MAG: GNAT family N-acetyltransferase [Streptosporangiales bacterium]|nr:GNAT family N-acetyltransferase [Streptosporangiales bacterium]